MPPDPNPGDYVDFLSYFATTVPGACVSSNPTSPSGDRISIESPSGCGRDMYHYTKGVNSNNYPFAIETFFVEGSFVKLIEEISINNTNPWCLSQSEGYRSFVDLQTYHKGFRWALTGFRGDYASFPVPTYLEHYWVYDSTNPPQGMYGSCAPPGTGPYYGCYLGSYPICPPGHGDCTASSYVYMWTESWPGWLTNRLKSDAVFDVSVVAVMGCAGYCETYYYGKFWDPDLAAWQGLGQIAYQQQPNGGYLVSCDPQISCVSCP